MTNQIPIEKRRAFINEKPEVYNELKGIFGKLNNIIVADIGACEGLSSLKYEKAFGGGKYYLFEPREDNLRLILDNIKTLAINKKNFTTYRCALGNAECHTDFYFSYGDIPNVTDWNPGNKSSSILEPKEHLNEHKWCKFKHTSVPIKRLDTFHLNIDFIHIDVQGAELDVFKGGTETLKKVRAIWCEVAMIELYKGQALKQDITNFLTTQGFKPLKEILNSKWGDVLYAR